MCQALDLSCSNPSDGEACFSVFKQCYSGLVDEISKQVFWARICADIEFRPKYIDGMVNAGGNFCNKHQATFNRSLEEVIYCHKPIIIYSAGRYGQKWCKYLQSISANLKGFFDQNYKNTPTCMGLPVFPPPKCAEEFKDCYILVSAIDYIDQIRTFLLEHGFSSDKILCICSTKLEDTEHQYFEFPDKYPKGGAFVDAGCFDCGTSLRFVDWCEGAYSKIFAFEPDASNLARCQKIAQEHKVRDIVFYQAGLYGYTGKAAFSNNGTSSSQIDPSGEATIPLVTLDEVVGDTVVSFIKMDIEGSELSALQGAAKTIQRDRPLCAISAYHKPGDVIVLMQYLKSLVPEYQFALRHYSNVDAETVLYAFL